MTSTYTLEDDLIYTNIFGEILRQDLKEEIRERKKKESALKSNLPRNFHLEELPILSRDSRELYESRLTYELKDTPKGKRDLEYIRSE